MEYPWSSYRVYGYGKEDGLTDRQDLYEAMGKDQSCRQKAYREYVCSNRDKEEQEIREKIGRGICLPTGSTLIFHTTFDSIL